MAVISLCGKLMNGLDTACTVPVRKYFQQAVVINKDDIETVTIKTPDADGTCHYNVQFQLKSGTTGYAFTSPESGVTVKGYVEKTTSDLGHPQFIHKAQFLITGVDETTKCILDALSRGLYIVAFQMSDDTVEIYGMVNGLVAEDFTYDVVDGGGGVPFILSSLETAPEPTLPLVYVSDPAGTEVADFDSKFAQPATP